MLHHPYGPRSGTCPVPGTAVADIVGAFVAAGGSAARLCALLGDHVPTQSPAPTPAALADPKQACSLEFYFYVFTFAKILLDDPLFCHTIDGTTQLPRHHVILEQGPMKFPPWRLGFDSPPDGYLSITNMRSMFVYVEDAAPAPPFAPEKTRAESGSRLAREALAFLNACAPCEYRVDRGFFDKEEVLISLEYLFYISCILQLLTNDDRFVYHSLRYGTLHSNSLARTIFLQPALSPVDGFRQWQARTNHVYNMEFREKGRILWVRMNLTKTIRTGMFGVYRNFCAEGIRQACLAVHGSFMELATRKTVDARIVETADDPDSFFVRIRRRPPRSGLMIPAAIIGGAAALLIGQIVPTLVPASAQLTAIRISGCIVIAAVSAAWIGAAVRLRRMEHRFAETREVIDRQFRALSKNADELLLERDTLEKKVIERTRELADALDQVKALDRAKTNFIANVSHELRTPLTLLSAPIDAIRHGRYGENLDAGDPVFGLIERNIERLGTQINSLLEFARLDLGTMPFEPHPLGLASYCRGIVAELQSLAERKGLDLFFDNSTGCEEIVVTADHALLETVVLNLLNNALKFTERGSVGIILDRSTDDEAVVLRVTDTGIGFPAAEKERIFGRFMQLDGNTDRRHEGAGLGLALTREITELHGWHLDADGAPGEGASFRITIPVTQRDDREPPSSVFASRSDRERRARSGIPIPVKSAPACGDAEGSGTVLVVDDNADMIAVLQWILGSCYTVLEARNGEEALSVLEREPEISLIICDVMMPGMSGLEFRESLIRREDWSEIPFVFLTALGAADDRLLGLEAGALDYIQKPFSGEQLLLKVRNVIDAQDARYRRAVADTRAADRLLRRVAEYSSPGEEPDSTFARYDITAAERRVLELVREGLQDKEIAGRLSLSPRTVSSHLGNLYRKTGTGNRTELTTRLFGPRAGR